MKKIFGTMILGMLLAANVQAQMELSGDSTNSPRSASGDVSNADFRFTSILEFENNWSVTFKDAAGGTLIAGSAITTDLVGDPDFADGQEMLAELMNATALLPQASGSDFCGSILPSGANENKISIEIACAQASGGVLTNEENVALLTASLAYDYDIKGAVQMDLLIGKTPTSGISQEFARVRYNNNGNGLTELTNDYVNEIQSDVSNSAVADNTLDLEFAVYVNGPEFQPSVGNDVVVYVELSDL